MVIACATGMCEVAGVIGVLGGACGAACLGLSYWMRRLLRKR